MLAFALAPLVALAQIAGWEQTTEGLAPIPALSARVTDLTGTLAPAERQALEAKLAAWEQQTGNQLAVLLVPSTQPEPIETYSIRVAEAWKIGRKGQDNGALLVVAKDDRKLRIEVGYGFEGVLTDATSRRIIAETITPLFRQNQFAAGINAGVDRIIGVIGKGEALPPVAQRRPGPQSIDVPFAWVIFFFLVVPALGGILRRIFGKVGGATVGAGAGRRRRVAHRGLDPVRRRGRGARVVRHHVLRHGRGLRRCARRSARRHVGWRPVDRWRRRVAGAVGAVAAAFPAAAAASAAVARRATGRRGGGR